MKIKLSKSQWEEMGKKAGWVTSLRVPQPSSIYEDPIVKKGIEDLKDGIANMVEIFNSRRGGEAFMIRWIQGMDSGWISNTIKKMRDRADIYDGKKEQPAQPAATTQPTV